MRASLIIAILLSLLLVIFALSNNYIVDINLLLWNFKVSMPLLLISTFALGVLAAMLYNMPSWWRTRKLKKSLAKENQSLKDQINQLGSFNQNTKDINQTGVDDFVKDVDKE